MAAQEFPAAARAFPFDPFHADVDLFLWDVEPECAMNAVLTGQAA
jgi:hypothetical protein